MSVKTWLDGTGRTDLPNGRFLSARANCELRRPRLRGRIMRILTIEDDADLTHFVRKGTGGTLRGGRCH
jgi:hypothetical protein